MTERRSKQIRALFSQSPVIPVLVIDDAKDAIPLARALRDGGLNALEITLRTPAALPSIAAIAAQLPEMAVGAGTVLNENDARRARDAGARFAVSPGYTATLRDVCEETRLPYLPGVATASEVMEALDDGYDLLKFFPAEAAGGLAMLNALVGPFPGVSFCPTGGIDATNAPAYLAQSNVLCVGGSWLAPRAVVAARNWMQVTARASAVVNLRRAAQ